MSKIKVSAGPAPHWRLWGNYLPLPNIQWSLAALGTSWPVFLRTLLLSSRPFPLCIFPYKDHIRFNVCVCLLSRVQLFVTPWTVCSSSGSSVHGISQATIVEWVAISFSRESSWPRDRTHIPCILCIAGRLHFFFFLMLSYQGSPVLGFKWSEVKSLSRV